MQGLITKRHALFTLRHAKFLPDAYEEEDTNRMTLGYFCLSSLALLPDPSSPSTSQSEEGHQLQLRTAIETTLRAVQRQGFVDWIYAQQRQEGGFRGSDSLASLNLDIDSQSSSSTPSDQADSLDPTNIIQSYTAILNLALLDDDLARLDRAGLVRFVGDCQMNDGSFVPFPGCREPGDLRTTYAAFVIASILDDWSSIDVDLALKFVNSCRRYEGAYAQRPGSEANAGPTYCAIASYSLCGRLDSIPSPDLLLRWLVNRQVRPPIPDPVTQQQVDDSSNLDEDDEEEETGKGRLPKFEETAGFQGRANKPVDACYSFWSLAALQLLRPSDFDSLVSCDLNTDFLLHCQHPQFGGIAREPPFLTIPIIDKQRTARKDTGYRPDVYHIYMSLAAISIGEWYGNAGMSKEARERDEKSKADREGEENGSQGLMKLDVAWNVETRVADRLRERIRMLRTKKRSGDELDSGRSR